MNFLIVGESEINQPLRDELSRCGASVSIIPHLDDITRVSGEVGSFCVKTKRETITSNGIIITQPPELEDVIIDDAHTLEFNKGNALHKLMDADQAENIVILLDYPSETPLYLTKKALSTALSLESAHKHFVILSKFVKTASNKMEELYRKAREKGVSFIKYERIKCAFSDGVFSVSVFDGVFTSEFKTPLLCCAGKEKPDVQNEIAKKFHLTKSGENQVSGSKYFLSPVLTSRKGIFYIHPDIEELQTGDTVKKIVPIIMGELEGINHPPGVYAEINAEKCAFCYSCFRVCTHAALAPDIENNAMKCLESACVGCGACAGICPGQAIAIKSENRESITFLKHDMCKVFSCENSVYPLLFNLADKLAKAGAKLDIEKMPCGGRVGQDMIAGALADYDKIILAVCMEDSCRHFVGDKRACKNAETLARTAEKIGLADKKIICLKVSAAMEKVLLHDILTFLEISSG